MFTAQLTVSLWGKIMQQKEVMFAAFSEELSKIASMKGLALVGLGAGGAVGANKLQEMHRLASKEKREQNLQRAQLRLARMKAITQAENQFMSGM